MNKRFFLTIAMFSLFAMGFASTASADTLIDAKSEPVKTGSSVTLVTTNLTSTFTGGNTTGCSNITIGTEVSKNGPEQIALKPVTFFASGCLLKPLGAGMFISSPGMGTITLAEGEGSASFQSTESVPAAGLTCTYSGTFGFTYELETSNLNIPGSPFTKTSGTTGCPETKEMHGDFKMSNGLGAVKIS